MLLEEWIKRRKKPFRNIRCVARVQQLELSKFHVNIDYELMLLDMVLGMIDFKIEKGDPHVAVSSDGGDNSSSCVDGRCPLCEMLGFTKSREETGS